MQPSGTPAPGRGVTRRSAAALLCLLLVPLAGCQKLQARVEIKKGNTLYQNEDYRGALAQFQKGLELDPSISLAWRSLGPTAMALYRPGVEGPDNDGYAQQAIDAFEKYLLANPRDPKVEEYLITVLINAERYDEALERLDRKAQSQPVDPAVEPAIITTLIKAGRLDAALARAGSLGEQQDPQAFYSIGVAAWSQSYNDPALDQAARSAVVDLGLEATRRALELKPDYFDAMAYYNLLFREKAKLATDPEEAQKWFALAEEWTQKALALREKQEREEAGSARPRS